MTGKPNQISGRHALVFGIGNALRRDDGVGQAVVEALERKHFSHATLAAVHQLTPELSEDLSSADVVVFVDADVDAQSMHVDAIEADEIAMQPLAHIFEPASLVALAQHQYGRAPQAWVVGIPAHDLGYGEGLSTETRAYLGPAVDAISRILKNHA